MSHASECPLCGGSEFRQWRLGLTECRNCGLIVSPMIWQSQFNEQMEDTWFGDDYEPERSYWVQRFESWNNRRTLSRLKTHSARKGRLLEVGVGSGSFLRAAQQQGFDVTGCDLSASLCGRVEKKYGIKMHCGPLSGLRDQAQFDVVVMNHVLEHVQQPTAFLRDVASLLSADGRVHIAVPNIACWEAHLPGWTSYEPYHLSYFDPETLRRMVESAGLAVTHVSTHDSFSGWFLAVLRTAVGINKDQETLVQPKPTDHARDSRQRTGMVEHAYRLAMLCSGGISWPLRTLQSRIGAGDEVVCIARPANNGVSN